MLAAVSIVTFFIGADETSILPAPLDTVFGVIGILLLIVLMIVFLATWAYIAVATLKAIYGSVWTYPGSVDIVERFRQ